MAIYPNWLAGQDITADSLNAMQPLIAIKTAGEAVTSSTAMQNDNELFLPAVASATYLMELYLMYDSSTASDIKIGWTVPTGATMIWAPMGANLGEATNSAVLSMNLQSRVETETANLGGSTSTGIGATAWGVLIMSTTAGNLQFQWAQATSGATATNVRVPSTLKLTRIS